MIVVKRTKELQKSAKNLSLPRLIQSLKFSRSTKGVKPSICHSFCHFGLTGHNGNRTGINFAESTFTGAPLAVPA